MTYLLDTNGPLPEYRPAFEDAVGHGFSKAVILWDGPDHEAGAAVFEMAGYRNKGIRILLDRAINTALGTITEDSR